ncbi:MAG: NAD(P)H-dependent oxidoreductase subunit E [Limisphaerales bacterium]
MSFTVTSTLEAEVDELISHYPVKRRRVVDGCCTRDPGTIRLDLARGGFVDGQKNWNYSRSTSRKILTFYPMLRQEPMGKYQIKVCRTLSCALGGAYELREHFCKKFGLDAHKHGAQTTKDGKFTVEFVECLASCGTAPVMMVNDDFYEGVSHAKADEICAKCQ